MSDHPPEPAASAEPSPPSSSSNSNQAMAFPKPPPAQPVYILRGHTAAIHSVEFIRGNTRLVSGDADGWVVSWDVATKRAAGVWKAHDNAILRTTAWGSDKIITHGRDQKLRVWKLELADERSLSKALPADEQQKHAQAHRQQPWLLHSLDVNTLNFCALAMCETNASSERVESSAAILIAVPTALDSDGIDIFQLPSEKRIHTISKDSSTKTGMVMALGLFQRQDSLYVVAGYESGHTKVFENESTGGHTSSWKQVYSHQPHSQPVLSLAIMPCRDAYLTSSADAVLAKHNLPIDKQQDREQACLPKTINTKHAGQQGLTIRSDGKILATAGWDGRMRVYATSSMMELAVLKWHKDGCYATAFAEIEEATDLKPCLTSGSSTSAKRTSDAVDEQQQALIAKEGNINLRALSERRRSEKARSTHWLAGGSKDGKISLWDIY
ncbi:MAG: ASTRA complex subunit [Peltula sp. TS41687]|nr:MAG: ASTRA complex subunit [Peltula sp. TS41687]